MTRQIFVRLIPAVASAAWLLAAPSPAPAQETESHCLPAGVCRDLRTELKDLRQEIRRHRRDLRDLRQQIHALPPGQERRELIRQAREVRREIRELRLEARPLVHRFRAGCRGC